MFLKQPDTLSEQYKAVGGWWIPALLLPRPIMLVTSCDSHGVPNVLTLAWATPLSHEPPLAGIAVQSSHYSHKLIVETGEFVINLVGKRFERAINICGNYSGSQYDKFKMGGLETRPAYQVRPPVIAGALGHIECRVEQEFPTGDHTFFVGRILYAEAQADVFGNSWQVPDADVLLTVRADLFGTVENLTTRTR